MAARDMKFFVLICVDAGVNGGRFTHADVMNVPADPLSRFAVIFSTVCTKYSINPDQAGVLLYHLEPMEQDK